MYKEEADKYHIFLIKCTKESEEHISNVMLYNVFKNWFKNKYFGKRFQTIENLWQELENTKM